METEPVTHMVGIIMTETNRQRWFDITGETPALFLSLSRTHNTDAHTLTHKQLLSGIELSIDPRQFAVWASSGENFKLWWKTSITQMRVMISKGRKRMILTNTYFHNMLCLRRKGRKRKLESNLSDRCVMTSHRSHRFSVSLLLSDAKLLQPRHKSTRHLGMISDIH